MGHTALITFVLAFALGATTLGLSFLLYTHSKASELKHFTRFLLAFNLLPLINYAHLYLLMNFEINSDSFEYLALYQVLCFAGSCAKLFWVVFFVFFTYSSLKMEIGGVHERVIIVATLVAAFTFTLAHAWIQFGGMTITPDVVGTAVDLVTFLPLLWTVLLYLSKSRGVRSPAGGEFRFIVVASNFIVFCLILSSRILHYFGYLDLGSHLFLSFLLTVPMNLVALIFLRVVARPGYVSTVAAEAADGLNLSRREMEIALLVCQGKTNREISEELYISVQTVKDHIHRVFRKTGARNRVELTNAVRGVE